jgi:hypothetical protein
MSTVISVFSTALLPRFFFFFLIFLCDTNGISVFHRQSLRSGARAYVPAAQRAANNAPRVVAEVAQAPALKFEAYARPKVCNNSKRRGFAANNSSRFALACCMVASKFGTYYCFACISNMFYMILVV